MNGRIVWACATCGAGIDAPDKGIGRAMIAAWRTQHQGHDTHQETP